MTTPREEQPRPPEVPVPTVTTAPARSRWRASWLPRHLGRARTSTVVLALLWLAVFTLYVFVRPPTAATQTTGGTTQQVDQAPAPATRSRPQPTTAPHTTAPATTAPQDTSTAPPTTPPAATSAPQDSGTTGATTAGPTTTPPASATEQVPVPAPGPSTTPGPAAPTS